ncbi:hypothetical protein WA158_000707 [Blastocystis sp. Blastoise]
MSEVIAELAEDKYLFTFQDETQLWISKDFIKKYQQLPFQDAIKHTDKYEDGSYYIDIPYSPMNKVIHFLMEENIDISSLNLKDSYDIYKTLFEYSEDINDNKIIDLLYHIKELFYNYLKENEYSVYKYVDNMEINEKIIIPVELFNLGEKKIHINGLITLQGKEELLYYSLLFYLMNITEVEITYDYASNIPLEYICPSCIKDIFPSLKKLIIRVTTNRKMSDILLNPNTDEYLEIYFSHFYKYKYKIEDPWKYGYYTESEMIEYNNDIPEYSNLLHYHDELIDSIIDVFDKNKIPKLYKYVINEAIYTNDYSEVEVREKNEEGIIIDEVSIEFDDKTNERIFYFGGISSKFCTSQILNLPLCCSITQIKTNYYSSLTDDTEIILKAFEEGFFDSSTILNIEWIKHLADDTDETLFMKIMANHVFPNVIELLFENSLMDEQFELPLINKDYFPKLHIITFGTASCIDNYESLFSTNKLSMIDTYNINGNIKNKEKFIPLLDSLAYTHSMHFDTFNDIVYDFPHLKDLLEKNHISFDNLYIDSLPDINTYLFTDNEGNDDVANKTKIRNSLERFLKSNILNHVNDLCVSFDKTISLEYLKWISNTFNDNKINTIPTLTINLTPITEDSFSEYLTAYENIMEILIPKASSVNMCYSTITFINRLIRKCCFSNTNKLSLEIYDTPDDTFYGLYTTENFPLLKSITLSNSYNSKWWSTFIENLCKYMNNTHFPSSTTIHLSNLNAHENYIFDSNAFILRCKQDTNLFMNKFICTKNESMSKSEIQELFDYIYDEEQLSKLINFITTGKIPKLEEFIMNINKDISDEKINIYKQQLNDSLFIQENHVSYEFDTFY